MKRRLALLAVSGLALACQGDPDASENLLPQWDALIDARVVDQFVATDGDTGPFPAAWRFECIHIDKLGEPTPSGMPPFQATVLNRLWQTDIVDHKLNIIIGINSLDRAASTAEVFIGSGLGFTDQTQCREPSTDGTQFTAPILLDEARLVADKVNSATTCSGDAPAGTVSFGTVDVAVPSTDAIYIYAQNDKLVPFNCTADEALPNAVPLRYVSAVVSLSEDTGEIAGHLTACLTKADILTLCSCIGDCVADDPSDVLETGNCAGCPKGAAPLTAQLMGIRSTPACEAKAGGEAYELKATFFAKRLPASPEICGEP